MSMMDQKHRAAIQLTFISLFVVSLVSGCATPAKPQAMVVQPQASSPVTNQALKSAFWVTNVSGGKETNPLWTSEVGNAEFKQALIQSLKIAGLFAKDAASSRYTISAELQELKQPLIGVTFKVQSKVAYQISGEELSKTIPISAEGVGTMSDSWVGVSRLRIASENSIKENIKIFMRKLDEFE